MRPKRDYKFTVKDILYLIDPNAHLGDRDEKIVISEQCEEETWSILPMNSKLLWVQENLDRKVESIDIYDGMFQIWLADESREG